MLRFVITVGAIVAISLQLHAADKPEPKKPPATPAELLKLSPEEFIKLFDKNNDGFLTKDELPLFLAAGFDKADANGDGKLDKKEVVALMDLLRQRLKNNPMGPQGRPDPDRMVAMMLNQMDTDKDGRISKAEATGRLKENFDRADINKDGYLDKDELRKLAVVMLANRGGDAGGPGAGNDFDAMDKNADGRLSREELKGTRFADKFDEIDTNKDGEIDHKEFAAFLRKEVEKK